MTKQTQKELPAVNRTSGGLRDAIFDELDALRNNRSNPTRANAVAKLASSIVETVRMEIEVQRHARLTAPAKRTSEIDAASPLGSPLALGAI